MLQLGQDIVNAIESMVVDSVIVVSGLDVTYVTEGCYVVSDPGMHGWNIIGTGATPGEAADVVMGWV